MDIRSIEQTSVVSTNTVLKNTYTLLAMTMLFSALMAGISMAIAIPYMFSMVSSLGAMALIWFVLPRYENSTAGIGVVFAITGLLGFGLGPILSMYLALPNGAATVATAMGGTGIIFLALSGYALVTQKDFTFLGGFLMVGLIVVIMGVIANLFFQMPAMSLAISGGIILIMSGFILFDTSRIINGGETNYIRATVSLYLSIYNIFLSLLQILGIMGDD